MEFFFFYYSKQILFSFPYFPLFLLFLFSLFSLFSHRFLHLLVSILIYHDSRLLMIFLEEQIINLRFFYNLFCLLLIFLNLIFVSKKLVMNKTSFPFEFLFIFALFYRLNTSFCDFFHSSIFLLFPRYWVKENHGDRYETYHCYSVPSFWEFFF